MMNNIDTLSGVLMFYAKDHKTGYLFKHGPFHWLGPKRTKLMEQSWAMLFRDTVLPNLPVDRLRYYYHGSRGAPTKELGAMLGVMILQQMQDLTDEETVYQYAFNIQWHYALNITDADASISLKTVWNMRHLLTANNLYAAVFEALSGALAKAFSVDASLQRIDSVHIFSNMRHLGRISLFAHTIKKFLINLKRHQRTLSDALDRELTDRYLAKKEASVFSMVKPSESAQTLQSLGDDLLYLLERFENNEDIASMSSYTLLARLLTEQCVVGDGKVAVKPNRDVPSDSLQNPSDPDATYDGHKGKGYQVQIMETYAPDTKGLSLITHVAVEQAHVSDASALIPAIEDTEKRGLKPEEVLADSLYGGDENCEKAEACGVDVVSPVMGRRSAKEITLADFTLSGTIVTACPQGHAPVFRKHKKGRYTVGFHPDVCTSCPHTAECPAKPGKKGTYLRYDDKALRIAQRRRYETTPEFREKYRFRSGIEGTMSYCDRKTGIKHLRVRGLTAVSFCAVLKAAAVNILRAAVFLQRKESAPTTEHGTHPSLCGRAGGLLAYLFFRVRGTIAKDVRRQVNNAGIALLQAA
jgi:hypothetical protein